jgi:hypothetical protein
MKKALVLSLILGGSILFIPSAEATAAAAPSVGDPQIRVVIGNNGRNRRWNNRWNRNRNYRSYYRGYNRYYNRNRVVQRTRYYPNGYTTTYRYRVRRRY